MEDQQKSGHHYHDNRKQSRRITIQIAAFHTRSQIEITTATEGPCVHMLHRKELIKDKTNRMAWRGFTNEERVTMKGTFKRYSHARTRKSRILPVPQQYRVQESSGPDLTGLPYSTV